MFLIYFTITQDLKQNTFGHATTQINMLKCLFLVFDFKNFRGSCQKAGFPQFRSGLGLKETSEKVCKGTFKT